MASDRIRVRVGVVRGIDFERMEVESGFSGVNVAVTDVILFGDASTLAVGDVVRLQGTLTTAAPFAATRPVSALYQTFLADNLLRQISSNGTPATPVPEPSTYPLMAAGLAGIAFVARRKRTA